MVSRDAMPETPQQYTQRILGFVIGKEPLEAQDETLKTLARLIQPFSAEQLSRRPEPGRCPITEILAHLVVTPVVASWRSRMVIGRDVGPIQAVAEAEWPQSFNYPPQKP